MTPVLNTKISLCKLKLSATKYNHVTSIFWFFFYYTCVHFRKTKISLGMTSTLKVVDWMRIIVLICFHLHAQLVVCCGKKNLFKQLYERCEKIDKEMQVFTAQKIGKNKRFLYELILVHFVLTSAILHDVYYWYYQANISFFCYISLDYIFYYGIYMYCVVIFYFAKYFKKKFKVINDSIKEKLLTVKFFSTCLVDVKNELLQYTQLIKAVDTFNDVFGGQVVLIFTSVTICVLSYLNVCLNRYTFHRDTSTGLFMMSAIWSTMFLVNMYL